MIYDAWSRELTFANAGHDAPLLISAGQVRQLEFLYKGVLLGVRGKGIRGLPTYREQTIGMPPGAILVFYTDGLTDRRTRADGSGHYTEAEAVQMLQHAVRAAAASGDADAVATAAEYAVPGDIDDDMAILVVQSSPSELASAERTFPAEPIMVSEARRLAAQTFRSWGMDPGQAELACLLVSEVVTNAVLHASITPSPGRDLDLEVEPLMVPAPVGVPAGPASQVSPARSSPARSVRPGPARTGRGQGGRRAAAADHRPRGLGRCPAGSPGGAQGIPAAAAARCRLGVGGGLRSRSQAAPDPYRGGDRRRGPRPLPGRAAGDPVGIPADPGGQGGLVRDAAQRRPALTGRP
jgi:hypothetical protein